MDRIHTNHPMHRNSRAHPIERSLITMSLSIQATDAMNEYSDALIDRDLARQVTAIRSMYLNGIEISDLAMITACSEPFIESLLR